MVPVGYRVLQPREGAGSWVKVHRIVNRPIRNLASRIRSFRYMQLLPWLYRSSSTSSFRTWILHLSPGSISNKTCLWILFVHSFSGFHKSPPPTTTAFGPDTPPDAHPLLTLTLGSLRFRVSLRGASASGVRRADSPPSRLVPRSRGSTSPRRGSARARSGRERTPVAPGGGGCMVSRRVLRRFASSPSFRFALLASTVLPHAAIMYRVVLGHGGGISIVRSEKKTCFACASPKGRVETRGVKGIASIAARGGAVRNAAQQPQS